LPKKVICIWPHRKIFSSFAAACGVVKWIVCALKSVNTGGTRQKSVTWLV